ncbi:MAG: tyrosine-type recombinase/integrase [Acetobacteraceae bacterium]
MTDIVVSNLAPPEKGQKIYRDDTLKGFCVRVSQGGTKTFVLVHGADRQFTTLGRYPTIKLADARTEARRILAERTLGKLRPKRLPFEVALAQFVSTHLKQKNRPRTAKDTEALIRNHFPRLVHKQVDEITISDITDVTDRLLKKSQPGAANHAFTAIKTFLRWCVRRRHIPHSPVEGLELPAKPGSRRRVLSDEELARILSVAREFGQFGAFVQVLALTGQRRGEIAALHRSWVGDAETITLPAEVTKNKLEHTIPFGPRVSQILSTLQGEGLLFPARHSARPISGFGPLKASLDAKLTERFGELEHWQLHDLRRTFSTGLAKLGVLPHVKEALLNHSSAKTDVERIYDRYNYLPEMRAAMALWEKHIDSLLDS